MPSRFFDMTSRIGFTLIAVSLSLVRMIASQPARCLLHRLLLAIQFDLVDSDCIASAWRNEVIESRTPAMVEAHFGFDS